MYLFKFGECQLFSFFGFVEILLSGYFQKDTFKFAFSQFSIYKYQIEMKQVRKRNAVRAQKKTSDILSNPASPLPLQDTLLRGKLPQSRGQEYHTKALMNLIHYANVMEMFKNSISRFKGTNNPVLYKPCYNFSENWEQTSKTKTQRNQNIYLSANGVFFCIAILVMLHKIPMIWHLSIYKIFEIEENYSFFSIGIFFAVVDLLLRIYLVKTDLLKKLTQEQKSRKEFKIEIIWFFLGDAITILCCMIQLIILDSSGGFQEIILDYIVAAIQTKRFLEIYNALAIMLISLKYKNTVNLFGFLGKLFVILHVCAIILYSVTLLNPQFNWMKSIGKESEDKMTRYIYSVYFSGTTMFTVGYGDILPINNIEIIVILFIQVLGIIVSGYIINQIGHTLTQIRQSQDDFEQDIQNADTICTNYQLGGQLKHRVRNYIVNNRLANEQLNVKQENNILMKLNEELRNEVNNINHLNIVKTSLFFICHWSKKMQTELSKKLQKCVFSPNERISKLNKMYIITNGKVDVYTQRKIGQKTFCKKHLKTIFRDPKKEVFSNIYGCTSVFTAKPSKLAAVAKDFAICYAVDYNDFLDIVKEDERDFQFFHQTKGKLEQQIFPEKFQIQNLINNRQHYCPSHYIVLKKHKKTTKIKQKRMNSRRSNRKLKMLHLSEVGVIQSDSDNESVMSEINVLSQVDIDNDLEFKEPTFKKRQKKQKDTDNRLSLKEIKEISSNEGRNCLAYRSYRRRYLSKIDEEKKKAQEMKQIIENNLVRTSLFETAKNYSKFFKYGNLSIILQKLNKSMFKEFKEVNNKSLEMDWIDLLIFAQKIHKKDRQN